MASLDDVLTSLQNIVKAFNSFSQSNIQLSGTTNTQNLSATTLIKTGSGRMLTISVTTAGTTVGGLYDSATIDAANQNNLLIVVLNGVAFAPVNMTFQNGLVYIPGTGQTVAICYT